VWRRRTTVSDTGTPGRGATSLHGRPRCASDTDGDPDTAHGYAYRERHGQACANLNADVNGDRDANSLGHPDGYANPHAAPSPFG
jgi:hypothetical protein